MKKLLIVLVLCLLPITVFSASSQYTLVGINYPVVINGEVLESEVPPMNYQGTTMLPLRAVSEALDVPIEWTGSQVEINTVNPEKIAEACVMVYALDSKGVSQGSGVLIGYNEILTCNHVVKDGESFKAQYDNEELIKCDLEFNLIYPDIAILRPEKTKTKPVKIGDSDELMVGDRVFSISSPKGKLNQIVWGEILTAPRSYQDELYGVIANIKIDNGSSGGPVFNTNGELIGITDTAHENGTYIIPINDIRKGLAE